MRNSQSLRNMSESERSAYLASPEFRDRFYPAEQQMIGRPHQSPFHAGSGPKCRPALPVLVSASPYPWVFVTYPQN